LNNLDLANDPYAYLAINAPAFTESDESVVRRRLEMNWFGLPDNGESVRVLLHMDSSNGTVVVDLGSDVISSLWLWDNATCEYVFLLS
jgi:hypothetical protein